MERDSRKLIRRIEKDGWTLQRISGDHHTFKHPEREKLITVPHPRKGLSPGVVHSVYRNAGWEK